MKKERVAILSASLNFIIAIAKVFIGLILNSKTILADGIHSFTDVFSSFSAFLGIKIASKKADEKHPYGYYSAEAIVSGIIVLLILFSTLAIIFEGINGLLKNEKVTIELYGFVVVFISMLSTGFLTMLKYSVGKREKSLALICDAEHSKIDFFSSVGVFLSLFLINLIPAVDGLVAILIGIIILFEDYSLGKEVVDNLLGSTDKETEEKIKEYCKNQKIELESIKTRKSGSATFAEVRIKLPRNLSIENAEKITNKMRDELINQIKNLKSIVIEVTSHEITKGVIEQGFGRRFRWRGAIGEGIEYPEKEGYRIVIPFKDGKIYYDFGAPEYLIVDKNEKGEIIRKEVIKNPYFGLEEKARGMRIVKALMPNEIITKKIGEGAKQRLREFGIKLTIVGEDFDINKI